MDPARTTYVDAQGNPVGREGRIPENGNPSLQFMDKPYPGPIFDNVNRVFQPAAFQQHSFSIAQNTASTNFAASLNRYSEAGPLENNDGYLRNSFRINLDHRFLEALSLSVSGFHSRDYRDETSLSFADLYRAPPDVDLTRRDSDGNYLRLPDEQVDYQNPLWVEGSRDNERWRVRTIGSAALRWDPRSWVSFHGNVSYDRQDTQSRFYLPKGTPSITLGVEPGRIEFGSNLTDTWNAETQVSLRRDFGALNARTTVRALLERSRLEDFSASGENFVVEGVPRLNATDPATQSTASFESEIRSNGYLWDTAFDYDGKYIATVLLRRDESSLFGRDNREHTYYRVAGAWRLSEEDWFDLRRVDEFKISYARGTAGGRPPFLAQYETWSIATGQPRKFQLGNSLLRPEHTTEQEVSIESILAERVGVQLTYAWQETTDQLVSANLPGFTGYSSQWRNGGTVTGNTIELTIESRVLQRPNLLWSTTLVGDYSTGKIKEWTFACESPAWRQYCTGIGMYEIWGSRHLTDLEGLARHRGGGAMERASEFDVNDDGLLVWVGEGNSYRDGFAKELWGTSTVIDGLTYQWGIPFLEQAAAGGNVRQKIGDASHANVGWINNVSFGSISLHAQFHAKIGGDLVNSVHQGMTIQSVAPDMDQSGKPEELKKPMAYYQAVYSGGGRSAYYVQDGTYLKLRTLAATYRVPQQHLGRVGLGGLGIQSLSIGLIGRNLLTVTNYPGADPEQGLNFAGGSQTDGNTYPTTRSFTAEVSVTF